VPTENQFTQLKLPTQTEQQMQSYLLQAVPVHTNFLLINKQTTKVSLAKIFRSKAKFEWKFCYKSQQLFVYYVCNHRLSS
jgi:hypothetical protein